MSDKVYPSSKLLSDEELVAHFNEAHAPLAGLAKSRERMSASVIEMMRSYHRRVHQLGVEDNKDRERPVNHVHRNPNKKGKK